MGLGLSQRVTLKLDHQVELTVGHSHRQGIKKAEGGDHPERGGGGDSING